MREKEKREKGGKGGKREWKRREGWKKRRGKGASSRPPVRLLLFAKTVCNSPMILPEMMKTGVNGTSARMRALALLRPSSIPSRHQCG